MAEFNMAAALEKQLAARKAAPRTIDTVTAEILDLNQQGCDTVIAIGQRLIEAKGMLAHGEWLPWLTERVNYSERTAQNFMRLAKAYSSNPQLVADLGTSKAVALLALPEAEREEFLTELHEVDGKTKPVADLSRKEFGQAVRQRTAKERPQRRRTNGDRYRAMSDEELAERIMCPYDDTSCQKYGANCFQCSLEYLQAKID